MSMHIMEEGKQKDVFLITKDLQSVDLDDKRPLGLKESSERLQFFDIFHDQTILRKGSSSNTLPYLSSKVNVEFPSEVSLSPDGRSAALYSLSAFYIIKSNNCGSWEIAYQEDIMISADTNKRCRGDIYIHWIDNTTCLLSNRFDSNVMIIHDQRKLFSGSIPTQKRSPISFDSLVSYPMAAHQFLLFGIDQKSTLCVCDLLCDRIRNGKLPNGTEFRPISLNGHMVVLRSYLSPPYKVKCIKSQPALLIVARLTQALSEGKLEDQMGYAMIPISKSSIIGNPQLKTFSGQLIEKGGLLHKLNTMWYSQRVVAQIRSIDVNPSGKKFIAVISDGRVLVIDLVKGGIASRFDDQDSQDDGKSDTTSIDAISVVNPLDLQMVNWAQWLTDELLLMTNLQGGMCVMVEGTYRNLLGDDWVQFNEGASVSGCYDDKQQMHCLVLNDERRWFRNRDEQRVLVHHFSLWRINQVNPWEKFIHCIETKEYGEALNLSSEYGYNTDRIFKHRWCCHLNWIPTHDDICNETLSPPHSYILSSSDSRGIESNLLKIKDTLYVLKECLLTQIDDRTATTNLLKVGLRACNAWLHSHNYYIRQEQDMDRLESSYSCYYSYTANDIENNKLLREIVSFKFLLCVKLKRMQLYNRILAMGRSFSGFNVEEFNLYSQSTVYKLALRFSENAESTYLEKLITTYPQCVLPYRYDIVSHFPLVTEPSKYLHFLPAFDDSQEERGCGVFACWNDNTVWEINTLNGSEVQWFEKREILPLLNVDNTYKPIVQEFIKAYEDIQTESVRQSDYSLFVTWITERCKMIDDCTGLTNLSKDLIKQALELTSSNLLSPSYEDLLQLDNHIDLFSLYLDQLFVIDSSTDLLGSSSQMTLSEWMQLSPYEVMQHLFTCAEDKFIEMTRLLVARDLVKQKDISDYISASIQQDPNKISLFTEYLKYFKSSVLSTALSEDVSTFSSFYQTTLQSDSLTLDKECLSISIEVGSALLQSVLLPSSHHQPIESLLRVLLLYKELYVALPTLSLSHLQSVLAEDDEWFGTHSFDLMNASLDEIDVVLSRPMILLIRDAALALLKENLADKVVSTINAIFSNSLLSYPNGLANYILLPSMLKNETANSLNAASRLTSCVKQEWMTLTVLRGVDEEVKSMNELNKKQLEANMAYLNLVSEHSKDVVSYQNYLSALILLASHTPHLAPLELSILILQWNKQSHVEEDQEDSLFQHLSPQAIDSAAPQSPSQFLLSMDHSFYRISNQYRSNNTLYLRRILGDLGCNHFTICWSFVEFAKAACDDGSLQHALWFIHAVIDDLPVVETMSNEMQYEVVEVFLVVIDKALSKGMDINIRTILKFVSKFATTKQLMQVSSCYDSYLTIETPQYHSFDEYAFSCWKGNESIPSKRLERFDSSIPLLSSTFSHPSTFFSPGFSSPATSLKSTDIKVRQHFIQSISHIQSTDEWIECLLSALGPDEESQGYLLSLVLFFPKLQPHYQEIVTKCKQAHIPSHAFLQFQEWWMLCEMIWKEKKFKDFAIRDAMDSSIAVAYQTFLKLAKLQLDDPFDLIRCIVDPAFLQAILLNSLSSHHSQDVERVFAILDLNTEWNTSIYFQKYMEIVLSDLRMTEETMTLELSKYKVIEHLEATNSEEYHLFLYDLLQRCGSRFASMNVLLTEILRYEPSASSLISKVTRMMVLLGKEDLYCDIREFFSFSSQPPFSYTTNNESWLAFLWEHIDLKSLHVMQEICSLFNLPENQANECYVQKTVFDSTDLSHIDWNDAITTVCPQLSRMNIDSLIQFSKKCLFSQETQSIMEPRFLPARQLLVDSTLGILKTTQHYNEEILLFSHLQACQSVTAQLKTDFFEYHANEPLDQIVIQAYDKGLDIPTIEMAISIVESAYGVSNEKIMLSFVVDMLKEILEFQKKEEIQQFKDVFHSVVQSWRDSKNTLISELLKRLLELFVEFQNSDISFSVAKLVLFLVKSEGVGEVSFLVSITTFLIHCISPSIEEFQEFSAFDTFSSLINTVLPLISSLSPSSTTSTTSTTSSPSTLSLDEILSISEIILEAMASSSLYTSILSLTSSNVLKWIDGDKSLLGDVFRSNFFDIMTLNLMRVVSGQQWRTPVVVMKEEVCNVLCFTIVSKCFEMQRFDAGLQFAFLPVFTITKEDANTLCNSDTLAKEQRILLSELLYKRGFIDKAITEQIVITSFYTISYLIIENRLDLLFLPCNRNIVLEFLNQISLNVNEPYGVLCKQDYLNVLPFCFSLQFILAMAIKQDFALDAVEIWMMLIGCRCDFVNGIQQIKKLFLRMTDLELSFGDVSYGWKLGQQLLTEVSTLIDDKYGFFFCFVCFEYDTKIAPNLGYLSNHYSAFLYPLCHRIMERNSFMRIANVLRYNSPSKRQIRRQVGRPKWLNAKNQAPAAVAPEPIKYTSKADAPFAVTRTSPGKNLPVYTEYRNQGTQVLTIVRRIEGNVNEMASEIRKVCPESDVRIHNGSIHIDGRHTEDLRKWLTDLGF